MKTMLFAFINGPRGRVRGRSGLLLGGLGSLPSPGKHTGVLSSLSAPGEEVLGKFRMAGRKPFYLGNGSFEIEAKKGFQSPLEMHLSSHLPA